MTAPIATIRTQDDLIEALRAAKALRGLSNEFCDERGGLTKGHVDKVLGPSRTKSLSPALFNTFAELFAVQFIMVPNPEAEARQKPKWEGRDTSNVRVDGSRVSKSLLERAKPHVLRDHLKKANAARNAKLSCEQRSEIARKAGRARQRKRRKNMRQRLKERLEKGIVPSSPPIHP